MQSTRELKRIKLSKNKKRKYLNMREINNKCIKLWKNYQENLKIGLINYTILNNSVMKLKKQLWLLRVIFKKWIDYKKRPSMNARN